MYKGKSGIKIEPSHKGMLHRDLGVEEDEPISESKLQEARESKSPAIRKRAVFAENARHWSHKRRAKPLSKP